MSNWKDRLKQTWDEHPLECIVIGTTALGILMNGTAKLVDARSQAKSRQAYYNQVEYRRRNRLP